MDNRSFLNQISMATDEEIQLAEETRLMTVQVSGVEITLLDMYGDVLDLIEKRIRDVVVKEAGGEENLWRVRISGPVVEALRSDPEAVPGIEVRFMLYFMPEVCGPEPGKDVRQDRGAGGDRDPDPEGPGSETPGTGR